ncbi:hypothetical protein B0H13DRAFT_1900497 [Mycena leptocephala]|nr:hypothetical protein B0H13DRAFT_1900497 [Mycena leptocephala]
MAGKGRAEDIRQLSDAASRRDQWAEGRRVEDEQQESSVERRPVESETEGIKPSHVKNNKKHTAVRGIAEDGGPCYKEKADKERDSGRRKEKLRHVGLARRLRSPHIGSGENSPRETSSFPRIRRRRQRAKQSPTAAAASVPGCTRRRASADELGSAITLPKVKLDADLDTDEADTNDEGVDEAKERLVGMAAAVWNCFTRAWRRRLRRGRQSGETGRKGVVMSWGAREGAISIGWRERPGLVGG